MKRASGAATTQDGQQRERVDDSGDGGERAGADVGSGAGDRAGGGDSTEERRGDVGDALRDQLDVGVVAVAGHAVRDDGGEQAFDRAKHSHGEGCGEEGEDVLRAEVGQGEVRQAAGNSTEAGPDGFDVEMEQGGGGCAGKDREDGAGYASIDARPDEDDGEGRGGDGDGGPLDGADVFGQHLHAGQEAAGDGRSPEAEEVFDLGRGDQQGDAVGEADDDRARDELDGGAEAGDAHDEQDDAGHEGDEGEAGDAEAGDDAGHDDDEGAGGSPDLDARAAEGGDEEAGDDGGVESRLGRHPGGDAEGHRKGESDKADGDPGGEVVGEAAPGIVAQRGDGSGEPLLGEDH